MSAFITQVQLAQQAFERKNYETVISALEIAYEMLTEATPDNITYNAIGDSVNMVEYIVQLPEIKTTDFITQTISKLKTELLNLEDKQADFILLAQSTLQFHHLLKGLEQGTQVLNEKDIKLGQENSNISFGIGQNEDGTLHLNLFGKVSEHANGLTQRQTEDLQSAFEEMLEVSTESGKLINIAAQLTASGKYKDSNQALVKIIERYPSKMGTCFNLMGANYFFLQMYTKAIDHYLQALKAGENEEMIDFNVWEACVELIRNAQEEQEKEHWRNFYHQNFPHGRNTL